MGLGQAPEALHHGVEQHAQDPRAFELEGGPEFGLGTAALLRDRR
jgi:hypothetical protein